MNKFSILFCLFTFCGYAQNPIIYIKANANGDGSSWQNASGDLRNALHSAAKGTQIWVAKGTYYPTQCTNCSDSQRRISFEIPDSVAIYGGFEGNETNIRQRNWKQNKTILSGDIDKDGLPNRNTFNIIYTKDVGTQTILDGFTITEGNANDLASAGERYTSGAAWYNDGRLTGAFGHPSVYNCIFDKNTAAGYGAAFYNGSSFGGKCEPKFKNCAFINNFSVHEGGAIYNSSAFGGICNPVFEFCQFTNNHSAAAGGAVFTDANNGKSAAIYKNCQFIENKADTYGGGIYNLGKQGECTPLILGCLFWKNTALSAAGVYCLGSENGNCSPQVINSIFYDNEANTGGSIYSNAGDSTGKAAPLIVNTIIWGNKAPTGRVLRNILGTPTISNSIVDADFCEAIHSGTGKGVICQSGMIFNQDPLFVNPDKGDFHLKPASPAINAGLNLSELTSFFDNDLDSLSRILSQKIDIGCYEFNPEVYFAPEIVRSPESKTVCDKEKVVLKVLASATPPLFYQWYKNDILIENANADSLVFQNIFPADSGQYKCTVRNNQNVSVSSAAGVIKVKPLLPLSISITNQLPAASCENDTISMSASVQNGGSKPKYFWMLNGNSLGLPDSITHVTLPYQSYWHKYSCMVTSSEQCAIPKTFISNELQYNVLPRDTSKISIIGGMNEVCAGSAQSFTASIVNGGDNPQYRWLINGVEKHISILPTFNSTELKNNDKITCLLVSSKKCVLKNPTESNALIAKIKAKTITAISLVANKDSVCEGNLVSFNATPTGTGTTPQYQWFVNTTPVGVNWYTYETKTLKNNDIVKVRMTSSESCVTQNPIESNPIIMKVNVCTGVEDLAQNNIHLYPNPTQTGAFLLSLKDNFGQLDIQIINPLGQVILTKKIESIDNQSDIPLFLPQNTEGVYFIKIKSPHFEVVKKLMKVL